MAVTGQWWAIKDHGLSRGISFWADCQADPARSGSQLNLGKDASLGTNPKNQITTWIEALVLPNGASHKSFQRLPRCRSLRLFYRDECVRFSEIATQSRCCGVRSFEFH